MENSTIKLRGLVKAVALKIDNTFDFLLAQKIDDQPTWLFKLYNELVELMDDVSLPIQMKINQLLQIMKRLVVEIKQLPPSI